MCHNLSHGIIIKVIYIYAPEKIEKGREKMAVIRPFCAVRPAVEYADKVAALPYDVYNRAEAKKEVEREPLSFWR